MTLSSSTSRNDYIGNGVTDTYPYTFKIFTEQDLLVTVRDTSGVETTLSYPTDYAVTGTRSPSGGDVILVAGFLASGYAITIRRVRTATQTTDIRNQGAFFPEIHEDAFDHQVMLIQQQEDDLARAIKLPETEAGTPGGTTLPAADQRASKLLGFDGSGNPTALSVIPTGSISASAFGLSLVDDANATEARTTLGFSGSGATVGTADIDTAAVTAIKLAINSVEEAKIAAGAVITTKIDDGAVTTVKIDNSAVTTVKINDSAVTTGDADRTLTISGNTTLGGGSHSGTNTGDQTIQLTGDVTGSGTGSFAATIANNAVTFAKMQAVSANVLLGNDATGTAVEEITCTPFARTVLDDTDAATARTTLGVDAAGTDNSTPVTLAGSLDYITLSGQQITRNAIDLATDTTGLLDAANIGAGSVSNTEFGYLDGVTSAIQTQFGAKAASGANTDITSVFLNNTGLKVKDTNASHGLSIVPGSDLTADHTLTLTTGDADRTLTLSGNATLSGGTHSGTNTGDQSLFSTIAVSGQSDVVADTTGDTLTLVAGSNITITTNATTDSITIASNSVSTDAIWDAKGDLAVGTGANTAQKLTVGTNGHLLYADSSQTTG